MGGCRKRTVKYVFKKKNNSKQKNQPEVILSLLLLFNGEYLTTDLVGCVPMTVHLYLHIDRTLNLVIP